jgi:hypothetical protein
MQLGKKTLKKSVKVKWAFSVIVKPKISFPVFSVVMCFPWLCVFRGYNYVKGEIRGA